MECGCIVNIPAEIGSYQYEVGASSVHDAARKAIAVYEQRFPRLSDDLILTVILDGKPYMVHDATEHNTKQPQYRVRVGRVR